MKHLAVYLVLVMFIGGIGGGFLVLADENTLPVASNVNLNNSTNINLTEGITTAIDCVVTVTDDDSCEDIDSVSAVIFRTDVSGGIGCTADGNNCYTGISCVQDSGTCESGGSDLEATYTCTGNLQFFSDPTDIGTHSATDWTCYVTPSDIVGAGTAASDVEEVNSLVAINTAGSIDYGTLYPNTNSNGSTPNETVTNTGNTSVGVKVSGTDLTCTSGSIDVDRQEYSLVDGFSHGTGTDLSVTSTTITGLVLSKPTSTSPPIDDVYWSVDVPKGLSGTCSGTVSFVAEAQ